MSIPFKFKPDEYRADAVHVSLDLETASTDDNAAIVQIASVVIGSNYLTNAFSERISLASCESHGCHVSAETMKWWSEQDPELRNRVFSGTKSLDQVTGEWIEWVSKQCGGKFESVYLWGNGADFDCTILRNAYEIFGKWPLDFRKHEHLRTLKRNTPVDHQEYAHNLFMNKYGGQAQPHDALWDAVYQAYIIQHGLEYQTDALQAWHEMHTK